MSTSKHFICNDVKLLFLNSQCISKTSSSAIAERACCRVG